MKNNNYIDKINKIFDKNCILCIKDYKNNLDICNGENINWSDNYYKFIRDNYIVNTHYDKMYDINSELRYVSSYTICKRL